MAQQLLTGGNGSSGSQTGGSAKDMINENFTEVFNIITGPNFDNEGRLNMAYFTGKPDTYTYTKDVTTSIEAAIAYYTALQSAYRPKIWFPPGFYYVSDIINWAAIDGWTIEGVPNFSIIAVKPSEVIDGPIFNFNHNNSTIRRYNTIKGLYFFADGSIDTGRAKQVVDFSYNNRFGMYECRTSRISNETDIAVKFAYEALFRRCNFSGSRSLAIASNGVHLSQEANAIKFDQCSIDNYIGVNNPGDVDYIEGAGIIFEGSKGMTVDTCTMQKCDHGVQLGTGSKAAMITGGGYWEGNRKSDIRMGNGVSGSIYDTTIIGNSVKSGLGTTVAGLLFDKADVYGLNVTGTQFDNDDPIQINSRSNQVLQDINFKNVRTGDTIYSFRNLIDVAGYMYMDNIKVENPGTPSNAAQSPTFTPILTDPFTNHVVDFDSWKKSDGTTAIDFLEQDGTWLGSPAWKKNTANTETMVFTLSDVSGFENQAVTFSCWVKFGGSINVNDLMFLTDQSNNQISALRPLKPGSLPTTGFVKMYVYGWVQPDDTALKIKISTRDQNIYFAKPELKLGFV